MKDSMTIIGALPTTSAKNLFLKKANRPRVASPSGSGFGAVAPPPPLPGAQPTNPLPPNGRSSVQQSLYGSTNGRAPVAYQIA